MQTLLILLLPYIIGSAVVPLQIIIGLLLLTSPKQGLLKSVAYVAGMTVTRLLQGLIFSLVFAESVALAEEAGGGKNPIVATLLLVLGILLLISAYKKWKREDDPDDPPPKWLTMVNSSTPSKAFGIGFTLPLIGAKLWVFTLSAMTTIAAAQLGQPSSTIAFLLFVLLAQSLLLFPILFSILMPTRSKSVLAQFSTWLTRNNRPITIVVSLVFGLLFLHSGMAGLLSLGSRG